MEKIKQSNNLSQVVKQINDNFSNVMTFSYYQIDEDTSSSYRLNEWQKIIDATKK